MAQNAATVQLKQGLDQALNVGSSWPGFVIAYSLPIYDYRTDDGLFNTTTTVIQNSASIGAKLEDVCATSAVEGELFLNGAGHAYTILDTSDYVYSHEQATAGTTALSDVDVFYPILQNSINRDNASAVQGNYYLYQGSNVVVNGTAYNSDSSFTEITCAVPTTWEVDSLYQNVTYTRGVNDSNSVYSGIYTITFGSGVGTFKFNKVMLFLQKLNENGTFDLTVKPVPFAIAGLPATQTKYGATASAEANKPSVFVLRVFLNFETDPGIAQSIYQSTDNWTPVSPTTLSINNPMTLHYSGKVSITNGTTESYAGARIEVVESSATLDVARFGRTQQDYMGITKNPTSNAVRVYSSSAYGFEIGKTTSASGTRSFAHGYATSALYDDATAWGSETLASQVRATAFGNKTTAAGGNDTAFGLRSFACSDGAFGTALASGVCTSAVAQGTATFGLNTIAVGRQSVAFGTCTTANSTNAAAFGCKTIAGSFGTCGAIAWGYGTSALGNNATAFGTSSCATGCVNTAWGNKTRAGDEGTTVWGCESSAVQNYATAWGCGNNACGTASTVWGVSNIVYNGPIAATAWGIENKVNASYATAFGCKTSAMGLYSTTFGLETSANGDGATAFGYSTRAVGDYSTAFGFNTNAYGAVATSFGRDTSACGAYSTASGCATKSIGTAATAWGFNANATGNYATAWGNATLACGDYSTAFGTNNAACGDYSTAFGFATTACGQASFTAGRSSVAAGGYSTVFGGGFNIPSSGTAQFAWGYDPDIVLGAGGGNSPAGISFVPICSTATGCYSFAIKLCNYTDYLGGAPYNGYLQLAGYAGLHTDWVEVG